MQRRQAALDLTGGRLDVGFRYCKKHWFSSRGVSGEVRLESIGFEVMQRLVLSFTKTVLYAWKWNKSFDRDKSSLLVFIQVKAIISQHLGVGTVNKVHELGNHHVLNDLSGLVLATFKEASFCSFMSRLRLCLVEVFAFYNFDWTPTKLWSHYACLFDLLRLWNSQN